MTDPSYNKNDLVRLLAEHLGQGHKAPTPAEVFRYAKDAGVPVSIQEAKTLLREAAKAKENLSVGSLIGPSSGPFYKSPDPGVMSSVSDPSDVSTLSEKQTAARASFGAKSPIPYYADRVAAAREAAKPVAKGGPGGLTAGLIAAAPATEKAAGKALAKTAGKAAKAGTAVAGEAAGAVGAGAVAAEAGLGARAVAAEAGLGARAVAAEAGLGARALGFAGKALPWIGAAMTAAQVAEWLYSVTQGRRMQGRAEAFQQGLETGSGIMDDTNLMAEERGASELQSALQRSRASGMEVQQQQFKDEINFAKLVGGAQGELANLSQIEPMSMEEVVALSQLLGGR